MDNKDKAWLLAVAYATTAPADVTPEEFLAEVERSEIEFESLLAKRPDDSLKVWEKLGS